MKKPPAFVFGGFFFVEKVRDETKSEECFQ